MNIKRVKRVLKKKNSLSKGYYYLFNNNKMNWFLNTKVYNNLTNKRIKKITSNYDYPISIQIEPTNFCNAQCVMCPNKQHKRERGIMGLELFKKIIDDIKEIKSVREICLSGFGEPFLDKNIIEKIKYVKQNTSKSTILFSNFFNIDEEKMKGLIDSELDVLNISFNGYDKDSYNSTMKLDYETTKSKIEKFLEIKTKLNAKKPLVYLSCVLTKFNENESEKLKKLWVGKNKVDGIYIGPPDNWVGSINISLVKNQYFNQRKKYVYPCRLFYPVINWNGDVGFCCRDFEGKAIFGNLEKDSFLNIWNSEKYKKFRSNHYSGNFESVCLQCDVPYKQNGIKWWAPL
ncbi:SPASM domain-containing protein [Candidatus Woesearchaeota archaeon]|nr:SPASM domain-containing protein [Candidatus Woesearchaeota archaeon]